MEKLFILTILLISQFSGAVFADECTEGNCVDGQGTYTYTNGSRYVGEFKDGKKYGKGTFTYVDGRTRTGTWFGNKYLGTPEAAEAYRMKLKADIELRIEAITGDEALKWAEETEYLVEKLADILQTGRDGIQEKVQILVDNNRKMNLEIRDLKSQIAQLPSDNSQTEIETINGLSVLIKELDRGSEMSVMRSAIDQMKQNIGSGVIILASVSSKNKVRIAVGVTEDLITKIQADVLAQHMSEILGGKGGGRANFANAGGPRVENLHKSFDIAREWIKNL